MFEDIIAVGSIQRIRGYYATQLQVGGLRDVDARVLLDSAVAGRLDERVRDRIVAETRGAIARLGRTRIRGSLASAHLIYGEWLRRENRRVDAREQLRIAHEMLSRIGAKAFAERAGRELQATGETVRKRTVETRVELSAQEAQIARLAGDGLTNPEIGAQLFLSPHTVERHLRKVFAKLGIRSRKQLRVTLADAVSAAEPARPLRLPGSLPWPEGTTWWHVHGRPRIPHGLPRAR